MKKWIFICSVFCASESYAEILVATRTVRSHEIITLEDVTIKDIDVPGALADPEDVVGKEARVILYAGRPIQPGDIGPVSAIERNQIIRLVYQRGGLRITVDARSLGRVGIGDSLRVMNLSSRTTVTGIVTADGTVTVGY